MKIFIPVPYRNFGIPEKIHIDTVPMQKKNSVYQKNVGILKKNSVYKKYFRYIPKIIYIYIYLKKYILPKYQIFFYPYWYQKFRYGTKFRYTEFSIFYSIQFFGIFSHPCTTSALSISHNGIIDHVESIWMSTVQWVSLNLLIHEGYQVTYLLFGVLIMIFWQSWHILGFDNLISKNRVLILFYRSFNTTLTYSRITSTFE